MEMTAAGWLDWRRDISGEADFFHASVWVELGHGREQRLRVGMTGMIEHLLGRATFDDTAEIHHGNLIRQVLDNAQIVGDEKIRQPQVGLELSQEVELAPAAVVNLGSEVRSGAVLQASRRSRHERQLVIRILPPCTLTWWHLGKD